MELPEVEKFITERRAEVLSRVIESLEVATMGQLQEVLHRIAGTLSLYSFVEEGSHARNFSEWLGAADHPKPGEVIKRRNELLNLLKSAPL